MVKDSGTNVIIFEMPTQLDLGPYLIAVSTDGITYRPDPFGTEPLITVSILKCPNGFTCSQEIPTACPIGYFCPHDELQMFQPYQCRLGTSSDIEEQNECTACPSGYWCPDIRLFVPKPCPLGFLCQQESRYSLTQLLECPAGYICKQDFTEALN